MAKDIITLRGEREVWIEFTHKIKKRHLQVWQVLEPMIKKYLKEK